MLNQGPTMCQVHGTNYGAFFGDFVVAMTKLDRVRSTRLSMVRYVTIASSPTCRIGLMGSLASCTTRMEDMLWWWAPLGEQEEGKCRRGISHMPIDLDRADGSRWAQLTKIEEPN